MESNSANSAKDVLKYKSSSNFSSKSLPEKKEKSNIMTPKKPPYNSFDLFSISHKILYKKYQTTIKKYNVYIVNSIIFDQKNHKVAEFKNYLLWDETSEFFKRFYKLFESTERIPSIANYYETYTLFSPVYFGFDGLIILIMNKWVKRKKKYLEYLEDKEEEENNSEYIEKQKNKFNYEPMLKSEILKDSSDSYYSSNSLKFSKNEYDTRNMSFSDIFESLSSQYSIYYNMRNGKQEKSSNNKYQSNKNISTNNNTMNKKDIFDGNNIYFEKLLNTNNNKIKTKSKSNNNQKTHLIVTKKLTANNSKSKSKIKQKSINKKSSRKNLKKTNININRNQNNKLVKTVTNFTRNLKEDKKEGIKIFSLTNANNAINTSKNCSLNKKSKPKISQNKKKLEIITNNIANVNNLNTYYNSESLINTIETNNTFRKNKQKINNNNVLMMENGIIKDQKKPFTNRFDGRDSIFLYGNHTRTYISNHPSNISNGMMGGVLSYEPISLKFTKLIKKKPVLLTTTNSLTKSKYSKNKIKHKYTPIIVNNRNNMNNKVNTSLSSTNINNITKKSKISTMHSKKHLVLNHINSIKNLVNKNDSLSYNVNNYLNLSSRNNSLKRKRKTNFVNKSSQGKNIGSHSIKPYKKGMHKINLNFNLNINFNIDLYKNKQKKMLMNNIINRRSFTQRNPSIRLDNKNNRTNKMNNIYRNFNIINMIKKSRMKNISELKEQNNKKSRK